MDKATQKELRKTFSKNLVFWLKKRSKTQSDLYKKIMFLQQLHLIGVTPRRCQEFTI